MKRIFFHISLWLAAAMVLGCSSERNTVTSKVYHNLTAHYNGYFYALEEISKIEQTIQKSQVDDYNRILRLFPSFDSTLAKGYDKEIQEAVKMASIAIQRHPNSKWVDDSYILVGKARLYSLDWGNAIQTFKYVNGNSENPDARHSAVIHLIRTFTEHKEYNNAQAAIDFLQKEKLNKANRKDLLLEKAYLYQILEDYDNMVRNLTQADPLLTRKDKRGRIYFIIGQVYQELGFESEAYNYYRKCLATNPEYEVDFYARLYMAQVAEISKNKNINAARKSFRKLLKDSKNKEFRDKIYYEMGTFELKQKNLNQAIENLNLAIREGTNKRIDGEAYLRLGEIYYDTLKKYELSQAYYDSAISSLPTDYEDYQAIKARQEILNEFVMHLKTIQWQDSLLAMASLDSIALRSRIDSAFTARKKLEEAKNSGKKKKRNRIEIGTISSNIFDTGEGTLETSDWYFGNPSAVALGTTEFTRIWGNVPLEDNWRRSLRTTTRTGAPDNSVADTNNREGVTEQSVDIPTDPVAAEYDRISKQIPRTDEQKKEALKKVEEAYFKLGDIYYFNLNEKENAILTYKKLLSRFPESEYEPEVLYKLYLLHKEADSLKAEEYASLLKGKYPYSSFAKILINPDYLQESSQTAEKQKEIYKNAYDKFQSKEYKQATALIDEALQLGQTVFSANLDLLKVLIIGQTEDISQYQYALQQFIETHPDSDVTPYATQLLEASRKFQETLEKEKGIQYIKSLEEPHHFVMVYKRGEKVVDVASRTLERFNQTYFKNLPLKTANLILSDDYLITMVSELPRYVTAVEYLRTFNEKLPTLTEIRNHKFNNFVITRDNFNILYRTKGLDEYIRFFEKNYRSENP